MLLSIIIINYLFFAHLHLTTLDKEPRLKFNRSSQSIFKNIYFVLISYQGCDKKSVWTVLRTNRFMRIVDSKTKVKNKNVSKNKEMIRSCTYQNRKAVC